MRSARPVRSLLSVFRTSSDLCLPACLFDRLLSIPALPPPTLTVPQPLAHQPHSPNCVARTLLVNGQRRIFLFALTAMPPGTELTYDYKLSSVLCLEAFKVGRGGV